MTSEKRKTLLENLKKLANGIQTKDGVESLGNIVEIQASRKRFFCSLERIALEFPDLPMTEQEKKCLYQASRYVRVLQNQHEIAMYIIIPLEVKCMSYNNNITNFINDLNQLSDEDHISFVWMAFDMALWKLGYCCQFSAWPVSKMLPHYPNIEAVQVQNGMI